MNWRRMLDDADDESLVQWATKSHKFLAIYTVLMIIGLIIGAFSVGKQL